MAEGLSLTKKTVDPGAPGTIPAEARIHFREASLLMGQGKTEDALRGFRQAVAIAPNYTEALHETGSCLQVLGRHHEASIYYNRALEEIGDRLCQIARYEESLGRYWVAISKYEEACKYYQPEWMPKPVRSRDDPPK